MKAADVALTLLMFWPVSCGSDDEVPRLTESTEDPVAQMCQAMAPVMCDAFAACCGYTVNECRENLFVRCQRKWNAFYRSYAFKVDLRFLDRCLEERDLLLGDCSYEAIPDVEFRERVWCDATTLAPAAAAGMACRYHDECIASDGFLGLCLSRDLSVAGDFLGSCGETPVLLEGEACGVPEEGRCGRGLFCEGTCQRLRASGEPCEYRDGGDECTVGWCGLEGTCDPLTVQDYCDRLAPEW